MIHTILLGSCQALDYLSDLVPTTCPVVNILNPHLLVLLKERFTTFIWRLWVILRATRNLPHPKALFNLPNQGKN